jgi:hypothetical protein
VARKPEIMQSTVMPVMVETSSGRLSQLYIPKTSRYLCYFSFSEVTILGILWVSTKVSELPCSKMTL